MASVETLEQFEALPVGSIVHFDPDSDDIIAIKKAVRGKVCWAFYDSVGWDIEPAEYFLRIYPDGGELVFLPGGHWISDEDYDTALATAAVVAGITELMNVRGAILWSELGFKGAPIYIDAHEILDIVVHVAETYGIDEWVTAVLGSEAGSDG